MLLNQLNPQWFLDIEEAVEYVSLIDADDNLIYFNHANVLADAPTGLSVYDFVEPTYHHLLRRAVAAARETGTPQHFNSYAPNTQDKRSLYSNWVITLNLAGLEGTIAFIATDVTELSRVEEELQLSDATLRSVFENSPDTIFILDRNRTLLHASKLEYGFESDQILGISADLFVPETERLAAISAFETVLDTGEVVHYETAIATPEGSKRFSARIAPIRNQDQIDRLMIIVTDVTERHAAEVQQKQLQEQLQQAQKMEAIGQLTGGIAHDFNNLLLTIGGNLELAQSSLHDPEQMGRYLKDALAGVQRGSDLNQRLLAFSRRQPLSPEALDVGNLAEGLYTLMRRTLGENIGVRVDAGNSKGHMSRVDRAQLENAVLNLALNARDAMPNGGELRVSVTWIPAQEAVGTEHSLGFVRLIITDNGTGMSKETLAQAIEPFFTTKQVGEGSGLGLSMVYGFVQQSGGEIRIRSDLGEGTSVEIDLPCVQGWVQSSEPIENEVAIPRGNGELILLAEDEQSVRELTAKMLEGLGYQTLTAVDGDAALAILIARDDIALLISDIVMPGTMNGYDLANRCRAVKPNLPVMLVSGHPLERGLSHQHERWSNALLQKPYRIVELARFVSSNLSESKDPGC